MKRINYKDYLANQEHFKDYEDFKNIKKELNIYDFKVELSKSVANVNEKIYLSIDDNFKKYTI